MFGLNAGLRTISASAVWRCRIGPRAAKAGDMYRRPPLPRVPFYPIFLLSTSSSLWNVVFAIVKALSESLCSKLQCSALC